MTRNGDGPEIFNDVSINLGDNFALAEMVHDTGFLRINFSGLAVAYSRHATLLLGNRSYNNVIATTRDTIINKQPGMYQLYFSKNTGLIGYAVYPSRKLWVKQ